MTSVLRNRPNYSGTQQAMTKRNIKLTIQYDGFDYHGWQVQPGYKTIQETINNAISDLVGHKVHVTAASRTDAGVSALNWSR